MHLDYGKLIKKAFNITKNNKSLWFFGFLLALFGGGGNSFPNFSGNYDFSGFSNSSRGGRPKDFSALKNVDALKNLPKIDSSQIIGIIIIIAIVLFLIMIVVYFIQSLSSGALIDMVDDVDSAKSISVRKGFKSGFSLALPLLGIGLLTMLPVIFVSLLILGFTIGPAVLFFLAENNTLGILFIIVGVLVLLAVIFPLSIAAGIIVNFASRHYVIKGTKIVESIKKGYLLLRNNIGTSILLWLINLGFIIGQGIVGIFVIIVALTVAAAIGVPLYFLALSTNPYLYALLVIPLAILLFIVAFYGGLFQTFYSAYWTLAFKEMTMPVQNTEILQPQAKN